MADTTTTSGTEIMKAGDNKGTVVETKVIRYHNPYSLSTSVRGRQYASSVVASQETMLENLRYMKREMEREDRKITRFQREMLLSQHPRRWTDRNDANSE